MNGSIADPPHMAIPNTEKVKVPSVLVKTSIESVVYHCEPENHKKL